MDSMYYNKDNLDDNEHQYMVIDSSEAPIKNSKVAGFSFLGQEALSPLQLQRLSSQVGSSLDNKL